MSMISQEDGELIEGHLGYAQNVARKLYNTRASLHALNEDDFESAAYYGLCEAARRYDNSKHVSFKNYCYPRLRGSIMDEIRSYGAYQATISKHQRRHGKKPPTSTVSKSEDSYVGIECFEPQLNVSVVSGKADEPREITYAYSPSQEEMLMFVENREILRNCILRLPEKERIIIILHYFADVPIVDLCPMMKATKSWLSKLHSRGLERIKCFIAEELAQSVETVERPILN